MINTFSPKQAFVMGAVFGFMVLCTIGFFVMLAASFGDFSFDLFNKKYKAPVTNEAVKNLPAEASFVSIANAVGLNGDELQACVDSGKYTAKVEEQYQQALAAGGQGTPYSLILFKGKQYAVSGALPLDDMQKVLDAVLVSDSTVLKTYQIEPAAITIPEVSEDDHILGAKNAELVLVEYSDTKCPFCQQFHMTMQQLLAANSDKLAWVYRHFPLAQLHPTAPKEAEAIECAAEQGGNEAFWSFADAVILQ